MIILADKIELVSNLEIPATEDGVSINGEFVVDVGEFVRGKQIEVFDRGNDRTEIVFATTRSHESVAASEKFVLEHRSLVPRRCLISLISDYDEERVERFIKDACVAQVASRARGATSFHSYRIIGGRIITKKEL
jgi:hypothetical protein